MFDSLTYYTCMKCKKQVLYGITEATQVMFKYGKIICRWCMGKDKNGEIRRRNS